MHLMVGAGECRPDAHSEHELPPGWDKVLVVEPELHVMQADTDDDPSTATNFPAAQLMQLAAEIEPVRLMYRPFMHPMHWDIETDPKTSRYLPRPHSIQSLSLTAFSVGKYLPFAHKIQESWPTSG